MIMQSMVSRVFILLVWSVSETVECFCNLWQIRRPSWNCRRRPWLNPSGLLLRDIDKDVSPPFTTEESTESPPSWTVWNKGVAWNGTTETIDNTVVWNPIPSTDCRPVGNTPTPSALKVPPAHVPSSVSHLLSNGCAPTFSSSLERAIEQVHALMDLYVNKTTQQDTISYKFVLTAVESLLHRQRTNVLRSSNDLYRLEELVWRLRYLDVCPSRVVLEDLWNMQQQELLHKRSNTEQPEDTCYGVSLVGRQAKLLCHWIQWSQQQQHHQHKIKTEQLVGLRPPPPQHVLSTFQLAVHYKDASSESLWELYTLFHNPVTDINSSGNASGHNKVLYLSRPFYSTVLRLIIAAPTKHQSPCRVLQDMERQHYKLSGRFMCRPTVPELQEALKVASQYGKVTDAAWLFQQLLVLCDDGYSDDVDDGVNEIVENSNTISNVEYWRWLYLRALCRSVSGVTNTLSVAMYAQRLLKAWHEQPQFSSGMIVPPHCDLYHQLLELWASSKTQGAGRAAEDVYNTTWMDVNSTIHPATQPPMPSPFNYQRHSQEESIHVVVMAYLQELPATFQNVLEADRFVRKVIMKRRQQGSDGSKHEVSNLNATSFPTIEAILAAYVSFGQTEPMAATAAERLFRFLLIQHRDGWTSKEPNPTHLKYVLTLAKDLKHGVETCVELFRLVSTLANSKILSQGPNADNICLMLKIMCYSGKSGYSMYARELFQLLQSQHQTTAAAAAAVIPDDQMRQAASHVMQCVWHEQTISPTCEESPNLQ